MDPLLPLKAFDRFQRRHAPLAFPIAVLRNFSDQGAGNASVLIAYWAFFSIFPLLLLLTTILGFVLHGHRAFEQAVVNSALRGVPFIGVGLKTLSGSVVAVIVGLALTVFSGLGVTVAAQNAFSRVYGVPHHVRPDFFVSRWRGLKFLVVVGVLWVVSTAVSGAVNGGLGGTGLKIAGIGVSLAINLVLFSVVFRSLTPGVVSRRELWPGIVLATVGWEILQAFGGIYAHHFRTGRVGETYGAFAITLGLLAWLYLGARVLVFAAETNVVLTRHLWPRSLFDPPEAADRRARAVLAKTEERDDKETIDVSFHPPAPDKQADLEHPPYAVAPAPARGEGARSAAVSIATSGLHTVTVEQLLDAIEHGLDSEPTSPDVTRVARAWIDTARSTLENGDGAATALADATRRTLGLAGAASGSPAAGAGDN